MYSFRCGTLNGGGTKSFRSRSVLKLKNDRIKRIRFSFSGYFHLNRYSSSLINLGRIVTKCSVAGMCVDVANFCLCSKVLYGLRSLLFRSEDDRGMINSVDVKFL